MGRERYMVTIIKVTENSHKHRHFRTDTIPFTVKDTFTEPHKDGEDPKIWDVEINYGTKDLYEVKTNIIDRILRFLFVGIQKKYIIVVNYQGLPIKETAPAISGKVLKVSKDWKGLDKSINSAFNTGLSFGRGAIIVLIVLAIVALFVLIKSGYIPTPEGFPI